MIAFLIHQRVNKEGFKLKDNVGKKTNGHQLVMIKLSGEIRRSGTAKEYVKERKGPTTTTQHTTCLR